MDWSHERHHTQAQPVVVSSYKTSDCDRVNIWTLREKLPRLDWLHERDCTRAQPAVVSPHRTGADVRSNTRTLRAWSPGPKEQCEVERANVAVRVEISGTRIGGFSRHARFGTGAPGAQQDGQIERVDLPVVIEVRETGAGHDHNHCRGGNITRDVVLLSFTEDALASIARKAMNRKTGARGLRSILEDVLLDTMFELPGMEAVEEVVVNEEVIEGKAKPLFIYSDRVKAGATAS